MSSEIDTIFYDFVFEIKNNKLGSFDCFFKNFMLEYSW